MPHNVSCFGTAAVYQGALRPAPASIPQLQQQQEVPDFTADAHSEGHSAATSAVASDSCAPASSASVWLRPYNAARSADPPNFSPARQLIVTTVDDLGHPPQQKPLLLRDSVSKSEWRRDSYQSRSTGSTRPEGASSQLTSTPDGSARGRRSSSSTVVATAGEQQPRFQHGKQLLLPTFRRRAPTTTAGAGESDAGEISEQREADPDFTGSADGSFSKNDFQEAGHNSAAATVGSKDAPARGGVRSNGRKLWQPCVGFRGVRSRHEGGAGRKLMLNDDHNALEDAEEQGRSEDGQEAAGATARSAFIDEDDEGRGLSAFLLPRRRSIMNGSFIIHARTRTQILLKPCIWIAPQFVVDRRISGIAAERTAAASKTLEEAEGGRQLLEAPDAGAASTSPEAYMRSLHHSEETAKDVCAEVGASDSARGFNHGVCWLKGRRPLGLVQSPRVRGRQHQRSSPLRFYAERLLCVFLYFVVSDVFMCALSTTSDLMFQHHPQPKLPDRFHDWIVGGVPPPGLAQIVTDCLTVSLFLVTILRHLLFVQLPLNVVILLRFFFVMSTVYWLRGIAIFLTTIPSSVPNCKVRPVYSVKDFIENVLLASVFQLPQCTDMIISGHTLSTCLCVATWLFYNNCNKDQADLQRAPFYIFLRWVVKHRRKSLPQQQQQRCYDGRASGDESVSMQNQVQQHQQVSEQYCGGDSDPSAQTYSDGDHCTEPGTSAKPCDGDFSSGKEDDPEKHMKTWILPPDVSARPARSCCARRDIDASSSCKADVASAQCVLYKQHAAGVEEVAFVEPADNGKDLQHEIEEFKRTETETAGERGADLHGLEPEQCIHTPGNATALLRSEAVVGATVVVTRTVATATAGNVFPFAAAAPAGFTAPRILRSSVSVSGSVTASEEDMPYAVDSAYPVPFATCDNEGISPSAAAGICGAFAAHAVEEEDERKSSTHSQEMEDFSHAEMDTATASAAVDQDISTDTESSREQEKLRIAAQDSTELRSRVEKFSLLTEKRVGGEEEARRKEEVSEVSKACRFFHSHAPIGQERPLSTCHSVSVCADEEFDLMRVQVAAGKRGETGGLVSLFARASCFSATRASGAVVADVSKASDDSRSVSQGTSGASSCSLSEEEDGRRALLAPHQSRRRHIEKEDSSPFKCCAMPPGLSSFFAAAPDLSSPNPMGEKEQKEVPAGTFVSVDEPSAAGRGEEAAGYGVILKNQYSANQAQDREEEMERMGQPGSGERRIAGGRGGTLRAERTTAGGRSKHGFVQSCKNCLSSIRRQLTALLLWGCSWNILGTWCILQAAANIIVIDTSFCHYTVDIFFGIMFSFGCFTFYHMIVCLLWAARNQEAGAIADAEGTDEPVTRFPAARYYRRRSSRCRGGVGSGEPFGIRQFFARGAGGPAELRKLSSPRRRHAPRTAAGSRPEVPEAAGGTDLAKRLDRESAQKSAGRQKLYVLDGNLGHAGSKSRDTEGGGDLKDNKIDGEDPGVALRGVADETPSSEGGSTAVALSIMREIRDTATCTGAESRNSQLLSGGAEEFSVSGSAAGANELSRIAANGIGITAADPHRASDRVSAELIVVNAGEEKGQLVYRNDGQFFAPSKQQQTGEGPQREMPTASDRHFQTSSQHFQEPPENALITNLKEARKPRLLLWNYAKRPVQEAEKEISTLADAPSSRLRADTLSRVAADAAPGDLSGRGTGTAAVSARPGGSREIQKKKRIFNKDNTAKGGKGRRCRVLQSIERAMAGEPNTNAAADIATSILRFPLVRCAAYFVARLEGLELP